MRAIASQLTSLTIVYSAVYASADQRKYQSSASLAFAQMATNAENVSIWWRHHEITYRAPDVTSSPLVKIAAILVDEIFKCIFMNEKFCILIPISLKFVPKVPINNIAALVQIMGWRR